MTKGTIELELTDRSTKPVGFIKLTSQEKPLSKCDLDLQFTTGKNWHHNYSCLFLQLSRMVETDRFTPVYKTEAIDQIKGEEHWNRFSLSLKALCHANIDRMVKFQCIERTVDGREKVIGNFYKTVRQLQSQATMAKPSNFEVYNSKGEVLNFRHLEFILHS